MGERNLRFLVYVVAVSLPAVAGVLFSLRSGWGVPLTWTMLTLAIAVLVSELLAVELRDGAAISLTYPLLVCAIVLVGPTAAAVLVAVSMLPSLVKMRSSGAARFLANLGQLTLTVLIPAWIYVGLGAELLSASPLRSGDLPRLVLPLLLAASVGVPVNATLFVLGYSALQKVSVRQTWRLAVSWALASQFALGLLGLAIAQVMARNGALGFALFVVPLVVARQTHSRYLSLREAYADTVRSLVAALEAKDPYTKGHSVRVARFATTIAAAVGLDEARTEGVEYAALLHDLGKIGISRSVLSKAEPLTEDEYDRIREHPRIGAHILESIPFLDAVRPAVEGHHQWIDGRGYGGESRADGLPLEARILAVADSFDAMTADRPYRAALSLEQAVDELRNCSGTQFDEQVVEAFVRELPRVAEIMGESSGELGGMPRG